MAISNQFRNEVSGQRLALLLIFLIMATTSLADQSLRISGNTTAGFTVPNSAPFNNLGSTRIEFRLHNWVAPTGNSSQIFDISESQDAVTAVSFYMNPGANLCAQSWADVMGSYGNLICTPLANRTDVLVRYTRDTVNKRVWLETWDTAGGGYTINQGPNGSIIDTVVFKSWSGTAVFGGKNLYLARPWSQTGGSVRIGWLKWHNGIVGTGAAPPRSTSIADLGDWRFEGNGTNQTAYNFNLSLPGNVYEVTPSFAPVALPRTYNAPGWTNWLSLRAGYPALLDGTASFTDETGAVGYQWEFVSGPEQGRLDIQDPTAAQPIILGHVFGTYRVRLTVTSPSGLQSSAELSFGVVATDEAGAVIFSDPNVETIFGAQIAFGRSPWPFMDERHKVMSEYYGGLLTTRYIPIWRNLLSGTASVAFNSTTVTGIGTSFNTEFDCQANRELGDFIVIRYADANVPSGFRYRASKIKSCTETSITLEFPYDGPTVSGAQFGKFRLTDYGYWNGGGDGANYYDNVLAHYSMYYRSGNTQYRDYARELADRFIESPLNDYFASNGSGGYYFAFAPRVRALSGLMMRALDGRPEIWKLLWDNIWNSQYGDIYQNSFAIQPVNFIGDRDPREEAYRMSHMALGAMLYPLDLPNAATIRASLQASVNSALTNRWTPTKRSDGSQRNYYSDRFLGQAIVTRGSTTVTANAGTTFSTTVCNAPNRIWFVRDWLNADQDTVSYACTRVSGTQLTLNAPYAGTSGTKRFSAELINGPPTQPFMQGIVSTGMWLSWKATGSAFARKHVLDTMDWVQKFGWRPQSKGLYYIRSAVDCEPDPEKQPYCVDQAESYDPATREYAAEVITGFSWAYLLNPQSRELLERGDLHTGVLFGATGFGGPSTEDKLFGTELNVPNNRQGKYFGFYFGFGNIPSWPAARLGGVAPEVLVTSSVPFDLTPVPDAQSIRLTVFVPSGAKRVSLCNSSPCAATLDARQGTHWGQIEYLNGMGETLTDYTSPLFYIGLP